ncbi:hypothetical protein [Mycolicibacterium iranicum]|uniref:Uncharacterized protein n=1 Tax=Mycolicibacterium iranicum TaxID=912594 RepID=A0ABT4HQA0_MYCIR|nr:hypothetical protein [Mycolicibacterium iranicum]MCZ0732210.1 hypothetical protein [Mycolicibacterium iranicum]
MPIYLDEDEDDPAYSVSVPGIYASLLPWAQGEYARSGDPRWRYAHADGEGGTCRGGSECMHGDPPPNPRKRNTLTAIETGEPVVVPGWIARGHRWIEGGWSAPRFELPWDPKTVKHVRVSADDLVTPAH